MSLVGDNDGDFPAYISAIDCEVLNSVGSFIALSPAEGKRRLVEFLEKME